MKYALIGCGRISRNHIKAAINNNLDIVAICDLIPENMEALIEECELKTNIGRYTSFEQMLKENEIDLVSIATESGAHAKIAIACIEKGVNVIIEKPMAMSLRDADRIIELSTAKNVKVCVAHQNRFNNAVIKVRKAVESGRFGQMSHGAINIRWNRNEEYYNQAKWRGTWEHDGGALMNQCIHGIDLLRWMMGDEIEEVYGVTRQQFHKYLETEDLGIAIVKFKNGSIGTIEGSTNVFPCNLEETLCLFGEKGTVKVGGKSVNNVEVWNFADVIEDDEETKHMEEFTRNVYGNGHSRLFADMVQAIEDDRTPYVDAKAGRNALELVLAIYLSQKIHQPVQLPLRDFSCVEMVGEFGNL